MCNQKGQSIVEFLVAASFALVPLLFLITHMGKVGDMQSRAVEASRYGAWEMARTSKGAVQIENEINKRILYKDHRNIDSVTDGQNNNSDVSRIDPLYFHVADDGSYKTLIAKKNNSFNQSTTINENPTTSLYKIRVGIAKAPFARINIADDGMATANVEFITSTTKWLQGIALSQRAHNTVLTETWRAPTHARVEDAIDSAILAKSAFVNDSLLALGTGLADAVGLEEWAELDPGHIEHDVVPCSRLVGGVGAEDACR